MNRMPAINAHTPAMTAASEKLTPNKISPERIKYTPSKIHFKLFIFFS